VPEKKPSLINVRHNKADSVYRALPLIWNALLPLG